MRVDLATIRRLREEAGLKQADMAAALGYQTPVGYLYLEKGRCKITAEQLGIIAQILGVPVGDLLVANEPPTGEVAG